MKLIVQHCFTKTMSRNLLVGLCVRWAHASMVIEEEIRKFKARLANLKKQAFGKAAEVEARSSTLHNQSQSMPFSPHSSLISFSMLFE